MSHHVLPLLSNEETPMRSRIQYALKITALGAAASMTSALAQNAPDNAIPNADGSRTILRSQQLPEANERHARWCRLHGGVDITNDGDVTLGQKTLDAVVCRRLDPSARGFSGAYIPKSLDKNVISPDAEMEKAPFIIPQSPRMSPEQDGRLAPHSSAVVPTISVYPNNGYTTKRDTLFYPASYAIFYDFTGSPKGRVVSKIPSLGCQWSWEGLIQWNPHQVDGFTACMAPSFQAVVGTNIEACVGLWCARGEGSFVVE
ncbi:hypothetical protein E5S69_06840 [Cupriavidus necator]|uniref:hypothetical protein n=1 Tax=Cupriavidus necator TaxID=106590 RepID=UPI001490478E|nr:hypothetical protein [Cupriavidus necator]NOV23256.1 hypothetical protein [Cupriavidus necator]